MGFHRAPATIQLARNHHTIVRRVRTDMYNTIQICYLVTTLQISAQESRRKKKEYVEGLERRVSIFSSVNEDLKERLSELESINREMQEKIIMLTRSGNSPVGISVQTQTDLPEI